MIPLCDLGLQYQSLKDEIDAAMQAVAAESRFILGPNVKKLEEEVAGLCQCRHGVGVASGTDALHLALRALDVGPGDEVITTPFTFAATTEAIGIVGATPVFVDVDPHTLNLDPKRIADALTPRTEAVLPVHLYGQPCDMGPILEIAQRHGLYVVEDAAQALGATYQGRSVGSFSHVACLSFFPSKNLGGFGDGGMVVTNNDRLAERVEMLRRHGGRVKHYHDELGLNSRLDELQAAILRVKLPHLSRWNRLRRQAAYRYNTLLAGIAEVTRPQERTDEGYAVPTDADTSGQARLLEAVYHQFTIQIDNREAVSRKLKEAGVGSAVYYPIPLHLQKVHAHLGYRAGSMPHAETAAERCLSLPMFPELSEEQIRCVVESLRTALGGSEPAKVPTDRAA
ncbi:MAG: DegT/DnrJ/EryC1/StrS family aminotransferase [Planctomycetota bacterium]|jgi:dTDP-4-amino-4,6-dideoxygalactose transaminase